MQSGQPFGRRFFRNEQGGYIANDSSGQDDGRAHKTRFLSGVGGTLRFQLYVLSVGRHEVTAVDAGVMWPMTSTSPDFMICSCIDRGTVKSSS